MRKRILSVLALVAVAGLVVTTMLPVGPAAGEHRKLSARLSGPFERDPGDPNGAGRAIIRVNRDKRKVCFHLRWRKVDRVTASHIHRDSDGSIVVPLFGTGETGSLSRTVKEVEGCKKRVARALIGRIRRHPRRYYVNVHTTTFPAGAIAGELRQ